MLFSEGCYLDTFFSGLQNHAPYYQETTDTQRITVHGKPFACSYANSEAMLKVMNAATQARTRV